MSPALKLLMVGYFGGALIFAGCLVIGLTNAIGLTWIRIEAPVIIGSVVLMMGSKIVANRIILKNEAEHG